MQQSRLDSKQSQAGVVYFLGTDLSLIGIAGPEHPHLPLLSVIAETVMADGVLAGVKPLASNFIVSGRNYNRNIIFIDQIGNGSFYWGGR